MRLIVCWLHFPCDAEQLQPAIPFSIGSEHHFWVAFVFYWISSNWEAMLAVLQLLLLLLFFFLFSIRGGGGRRYSLGPGCSFERLERASAPVSSTPHLISKDKGNSKKFPSKDPPKTVAVTQITYFSNTFYNSNVAEYTGADYQCLAYSGQRFS